VLSSITPVSGYHTRPNAAPQTTLRPPARVRAINDWMRSYAAAHKYVYLDYYSKLTDSTGMLREEFSADDLHPNASGYAVMAPLVDAAIVQAMRN
jgi:lysophospholipase L1-like esterase